MPFSTLSSTVNVIHRAGFKIHLKREENITSSHMTLLRNVSVQVNYFNNKLSLPCQFTPIHMFNAIKANFPTTLLQPISINTCLRKSLSQITSTLTSLSQVSSVQLSVVCSCEYLIVKNSGYPSI